MFLETGDGSDTCIAPEPTRGRAYHETRTLPVNGVTLRPPGLPNTDDGMSEDTFDSLAGSASHFPLTTATCSIRSLLGPTSSLR